MPFKQLGIIIVDEEHDTSYKQDEGVIYNARDMAITRANFEKIPIHLVTSVPSIETYNNIKNKVIVVFPVFACPKIKLKLLLNNRVLFSKKYPLVKSGELIHNLTHFKLKISYYRSDCDFFSVKKDCFKWISKSEIDRYSFPKLFFKSLKFIYA